MDYDVVIVGSGPAGLSAATQLSQRGHKTLVLERDLFGGNLQHTLTVEPDGIAGADLAGQLIDQATRSGASIESADVSAIELFKRSRWVACADGRGFSTAVVILATGTHFSKLNLPNEDRFRGRGVVDCTPCDGGFFVDKPVIVYGSHDYALTDAAYLARLGCQVTHLRPEQHAITAILGTDRLEAVQLNGGDCRATAGLFVRVGLEPASRPFADTLDLDADRYIVTNAQRESSAQYVLACGDIRSGARHSVSCAIQDGQLTANRASDLLATMARP
jgi:thioredoxin reductase (NADPH)